MSLNINLEYLSYVQPNIKIKWVSVSKYNENMYF